MQDRGVQASLAQGNSFAVCCCRAHQEYIWCFCNFSTGFNSSTVGFERQLKRKPIARVGGQLAS